MRGADTVNDEFEGCYNQRFESGWYRAEIAGRIVMMAAVCQRGLMRLEQVRYAAAERDGKISIVQDET